MELSASQIQTIKRTIPNWMGETKITVGPCEYCGQAYSTTLGRFLQGQRFCSMSCYVTGEIWNGGSSFEPYDVGFNRQVKIAVRKRDGYSCRLCGAKENGKRLHIHHIDYNKKNSHPRNLITLCNSCHSRTNSLRAYWMGYFKTLLNGQEGATTIPSGSTPQANGGGSAEHPTMRVMI
jgi:hypothetical protein